MTQTSDIDTQSSSEINSCTQKEIVQDLIKNKSEFIKKQEAARFTEEWSELVCQEGITNDTMTLLAEGFNIAGAAPLYVFMDTDDSCLNILNQIKSLPVVQSNNFGTTLRLYVHLFALSVNSERSADCILAIIKSIPDFMQNKEGSLFSPNQTGISKYLLRELSAKEARLVLKHVEISELTAKQLAKFFEPVFQKTLQKNKVPAKEINVIEILSTWVHSKITENSATTTLVKNPDPCDEAPVQKASSKKIAEDRVGPKPQSPVTNHTTSSLPVNHQKKHPEPASDLESYVKTIESLEKSKSEMKAQISILQDRMDDEDRIVRELQSALKNARKETENLREIIVEKQKMLDSKEELIDALQIKLKEADATAIAHNETIALLKSDRDQKSNEVLVRIASKLRVDYSDFKECQSTPMTIELGEIFKLQLGEIFETLESAGIKL